MRAGGWREDFGEGRPHAASASRAESNIGVSVFGGEGEKWANLCAVDAENMLCTWQAGEFSCDLFKVG